MSPPVFTPEERVRYSRHLLLPEVGASGQARLKAASVLVVGAGGLGSPLALYLAAAGVGRLGLVDFGVVEATNLHRQPLHTTADVGRSKLASARDRLHALNPHVHLDLHETRLTRANATTLFQGYDLVADGTDNFPTRYLINDACVLLGKPNVYASVYHFDGQVSVFGVPGGPCYRCLYPTPPPPELVPSCAEGGVLGVLPGLVGMLQATEVLKLLLGIGTPLVGRVLLVDALTMAFRPMVLPRNPACPVCGEAPTITELIDYEAFCASPTSPNPPAMFPFNRVPEITVQDLHDLRTAGKGPFVLDVRKPFEADIASLGADQLIPVEELQERIEEVAAPKDALVVVHCRSGARSAAAVKMLRAHGWNEAKNLQGGILAWSAAIDASIPQY